MGMAASQARYLGLVARQNNLEYQGQQINQERTILSQQATALYNSLLDMVVPTPPSTSDYTKVVYSGVDGATNFTLGNVKPFTNDDGQSDRYIVEINTSYTGKILEQESTIRTVTDNGDKRKGTLLEGDALTTSYSMDKLASIYVQTGTEPKTDAEGKPVVPEEMIPVCKSLLELGEDYYTKDAKTNTFTLKIGEDRRFLNVDGKGTTEWQRASGSQELNISVSGNRLYTFNQAKEVFKNPAVYDWDGYITAIKNSNLVKSNGDKVTEEDFDVYIDLSSGNPIVRFVLQSDLTSAVGGQTTYVQPYEFIANGNVQKTEAKEDCTLAFDAQGRITQIGIPKYDKDGTLTGITIVPLTASTTTDNVAYEDAYNQYEYQQYLYDKKQQEINAKTKIIQQEDRSLELKLQRLDNERTMVKTEIEAVKKVIQENIQESFKVFSG